MKTPVENVSQLELIGALTVQREQIARALSRVQAERDELAARVKELEATDDEATVKAGPS